MKLISSVPVRLLAASLFGSAASCGSHGNPPALAASAAAAMGPPECSVVIEKEIMIRDLSVVEDPVRAPDPCDALPGDIPGLFSFGALMHRLSVLAGAPAPSEFVEQWAAQWDTDQVIHGRVAEARPEFNEKIVRQWRRETNSMSPNTAWFRPRPSRRQTVR